MAKDSNTAKTTKDIIITSSVNSVSKAILRGGLNYIAAKALKPIALAQKETGRVISALVSGGVDTYNPTNQEKVLNPVDAVTKAYLNLMIDYGVNLSKDSGVLGMLGPLEPVGYIAVQTALQTALETYYDPSIISNPRNLLTTTLGVAAVVIGTKSVLPFMCSTALVTGAVDLMKNKLPNIAPASLAPVVSKITNTIDQTVQQIRNI